MAKVQAPTKRRAPNLTNGRIPLADYTIDNLRDEYKHLSDKIDELKIEQLLVIEEVMKRI